jgi:ammonium transporter, Amt family
MSVYTPAILLRAQLAPKGGRMKNWKLTIPMLLAFSSLALGQEEKWAADTGDTAWLLVSTALVMLMTPGLAFFYGGLVRAKNALNTMMMSYIALGIVTLLWVTVGFSLAFTTDKDPNFISGFLGSFQYAFLNGIDGTAAYPTAPTIPNTLFMVFQMMFAIITPALISGAIIERMKFKTYMVFIALWLLVVYVPVCHAVWSPDGFLFKMGALDFAGGTVVHITAGVSALVAAMILGPRRGFGRVAMAPHNVPFVLLGAGLLWFGWFGFNGGSAVAAGGNLATNAFMVTHIAAAAAMVVWSILEILKNGHASAVGAATGAVVGLVAITPAAGFVGPMAAIAIGAIAAGVSFGAIQLKNRLNLDDSLDVFACHGVGGITGAILTGVFASKSINSLGTGLLEGNANQVVTQLIGVGFAVAVAAGGTAALMYILKAVMGLRPDSRDEEQGLDLSDHGEAGYHGGEYGVTPGVSPIGSSVTLSVPVNSKAVAGD